MSKKNRGAGFTLIELLVVIAIIGIIAAILFPVFASTRDKARQIACISNARQMGIALQEYSEDNDERFMTRHDNDAGNTFSRSVDPNPAHFQTWYDWIQPYISSYDVQRCPSFSGTYPIENDSASGAKRYSKSTYLISDNVITGFGVAKGCLANIPYPSSTMLVAESPSGNTSFADEGIGFEGSPPASYGPTGVDALMCPGSVPNGPGEDHFVTFVAGQLTQGCNQATPSISARVTCIAVDGSAKSVLMNDENDGNVTEDANKLLHDQPGGYGGLYITGPTGELTIPGTAN